MASQPQLYPHGLKSLSPDTSIEKILDRLGTKFEQVAIGDSLFVKPASMLYELDGKQRRWDIIQAHSSVAVVLYHTGLDAFLVVRQFRPAVYAHRLREAAAAGLPPPDRTAGFTIELCAGLIDKAKSLKQIVAEEIHEEVGYDVSPDDVHELAAAVAAAGNNGATSHQFYAAIDDAARSHGGGGLDGEAIEVLALPFAAVPGFVRDSSVAKSTGLMFGLLWAHGALLSGEWPARASVETQPLLLRPVLPS